MEACISQRLLSLEEEALYELGPGSSGWRQRNGLPIV